MFWAENDNSAQMKQVMVEAGGKRIVWNQGDGDYPLLGEISHVATYFAMRKASPVSRNAETLSNDCKYKLELFFKGLGRLNLPH